MNVVNHLQKTITKQLRDKTGHSITHFASENKVTRKCIYDAVTGGGIRRIRVAIAKSIELPPSVIWPHNKVEVRMIDDLHYMGLADLNAAKMQADQ
ncbi:MAG: hypothetical protein NTY50_03960 [Methylobacter sp.]|nr:hypothetical protein [Methylobacter sp.]